jgi:hypothetical protein
MTAVGVARPIAQGQAITTTETALISARVNRSIDEPGGRGMRKYQVTKVNPEITITAGTKTAETRSTIV